MAATHAGRRRLILVVLFLLCLLFALFPEKYRSAATIAPSDPSILGLSGTLSQLGAASSVFGNQAAVEVTLRVADSIYVRNIVIDKLRLMERKHFGSRIAAHRWLANAVSARSLRGNLVQIETRQSDADFAEELIAAYAQAIRDRLGTINRQQTEYKRAILRKLVAEASDNLDVAQANYNNFRLQTRYSDPTTAIEAIGSRIPALEAAIKAKEVQLNAARQFATDGNMSVRQITAELSALRRQLAQQQATDPNEYNSVGRVVQQSTKAERLERDLMLAKNLYLVYGRYLEGTSVEDLTSNASLRIIEPPYIDTSRQFNLIPLALAALIVLIGFAIEFYSLRPPLERRMSP